MRKRRRDAAWEPGRLRVKGLLIAAVPLLFEIPFALIVMRMESSVRAQFDAELEDKAIVGTTYHFLQLLVDTETAIRGYVLTANTAFLEPYERALRQAPLEIRRLRAIAEEFPSEVTALDASARAVLNHQEAQRFRVAQGRRAEAAAIIAAGEGKRLMDLCRAAVERFLAQHRRLEQQRDRAAAKARRNLRNVMFAGVAANILAAIAMAIYFTNNITRRLAIVVDNTYRVERQEPLRQLVHGRDEIARLDARFHEMATALSKSRQDLEAFSYSVSHDLRAPLRAVSGYARMVEEDFAPQLDDDGKRFLATIRSEARRMGQLIDDLLAFSRLGRKPLQLGPVDVAALVHEALNDVRAADDSRVVIDVAELPPALADRAMLRQALVNLLSNAVKFSARNAQIRIEVGGSNGGPENVYWVRDYGVGFDMRYADKLFRVFQRLHNDSDFEGTGVGLAIVQRVIERHGGRVWAESEEGRGACFYFALPRPREGHRA